MQRSHRILILFALGTALVLTACAREELPTPTPEPPSPTLPVVVFATEPPTPTPQPTPIPRGTPTPTPWPERHPLENPLTGLRVSSAEVLQHRPLMVRVGNDPGARPPVGLSKADMVYEEIVEWWVTRFTAIFLSETPETIGPIRSARLIDLHLTPQYQGALASSGGSDGVRWELSQLDIVNLDEYFHPTPYFYREGHGWQTRLAFNAVAARAYMERKDLDEAVELRGFLFDAEPPEGEPATYVHIPYPRQTSDTEWRYDERGGHYLRWVTGIPLTEYETGEQLSAANVIIYFAEHQPTDIVEDTRGATSIRIKMNGSGEAWVLRDGVAVKGLWRCEGDQTPEFVLENGEPIRLKPGNSWVQVVPPDFEITLEPADDA